MQIKLHRPGSDDTVTIPAEQRPLYPGWMFMGEAPEPQKETHEHSRKRNTRKSEARIDAQSTGVPA